jgi:hypothetical protein
VIVESAWKWHCADYNRLLLPQPKNVLPDRE